MIIETIINAIGSSVTGVGSSVAGAIRQAANSTGTGFSYLLATAQIESGLNPQVKAKTSSATGLFQFIEQTWLATMKQSGAELGYGRYAAAIEKTSSGRHVVRDPGLRAEILNLRKDPTANAVMAGALTRHNAARLRARIGRDPTEGELYIAHFLGAGGAGKLISAAAQNPHVKAANLFPRAAAANRSIFYDKQGGARSVTGVYGVLVTKLARAMPAQTAPSRIAEVAPAARAAPVARPVPAPRPAPAARAALTARVAPVAPAAQVPQAAPAVPAAPARAAVPAQGMFSPIRVAAVSPAIPMPPLAQSVAPLMVPPAPIVSRVAGAAATPVAVETVRPPVAAVPAQEAPRPVFHDLFRTDGRGGVSAAVSELWGGRSADAATPAAVAPGGAAVPTSGGDLFRAPRAAT
jgi:Transglycosylase SLT domain